MPRRPEISVILLFNRKGFRADFAKASANANTVLVQESIDAEATLADAVQAVVEKSGAEKLGKLAPKTLVLATDVWSQILSLPRISLGGMEADELEAALRFEAETLSGIEIDDLSLGYTSLGAVGDFEQFWVNVVRQSELEAINAYLEKQGCREITLAHPAGFAHSGNEPFDGVTSEFWDELVYLLTHNGSQLSKVKQATAIPAENCERLLIATQRTVDASQFPKSTRTLDNDDAILQWLADVAAVHDARLEKGVAPVLRKAQPRSGTPLRHFTAAVLALAVLGFCFWHWNYMTSQKLRVTQEIARIKQPAQDKKGYDAEVIAILQDRAEVETEYQKLDVERKRIEFFLNSQDDRIAKLLNLLIQHRKPDLVIQSIGGTEDGLEISGFSINGESAQALAKRLRTDLQALGWMVNPAKQKGQEKLTTGGPWDFKILLTDVGPPATAGTERAADRSLR